MNSPEISTIMTVFNGQSYLGQAIESILNQSFRNFELIIVNDYSIDDSQKIIDHYSNLDSRIVQIKNPNNYGLTRSINLGISIAQGFFIARMDADDISLPTRFEKQIDFLERHREIGLLGTNGYYIDENGKKIGKLTHYENDLEIRWGTFFNSQFIHSSIMFRRSLLTLTGGYKEDNKYAQDFELYGRLLEHTKGANLKERLVFWRRTSENISSKKKDEQLRFGTQVSMDNINRLFGCDFVTDHDELLVLRGLYRGTFRNAKAEQIRKYLQILEKYKGTREISPAEEKRFNSNVGERLFESIFRKGINLNNLKYIKVIADMSPSALPAGIRNLGKRALTRLIGLR